MMEEILASWLGNIGVMNHVENGFTAPRHNLQIGVVKVALNSIGGKEKSLKLG